MFFGVSYTNLDSWLTSECTSEETAFLTFKHKENKGRKFLFVTGGWTNVFLAAVQDVMILVLDV